MIILGRPPIAPRLDGRNNAAAELLVGPGNGLARLALLVFILREDGRPVLRPNVVALTVELRRVMSGEEDVEQFVIADLLGIEGDADRLGMTRIPAAHLLVGGVGDRAAGVAAFNRVDA